MFISVIVPCFNEEEVLRETNHRLLAQLRAFDSFEIIYINDGSTDRTGDILAELAQDYHVKYVVFSRNFGHQIAVSAGIERAQGQVTVIIDADLQDPPELIGSMVARWEEGFAVVYGKRIRREGETHFKRFSANLFYLLLNKFAEVDIPRNVGDFRLIDRRVVDALKLMPERQRLLRGMMSWVGFRQCSIEYVRPPRFAGETKYPFKRMVRLAVDGLLSFSVAPLRAAIGIGILTAGLAVVGIIYAVTLRVMTNIWVEGFTIQLVSIFLLGGVQLVFLGVLGEYIGRIFTEVKGRPMYIVADEVGFNRPQRVPMRVSGAPQADGATGAS